MSSLVSAAPQAMPIEKVLLVDDDQDIRTIGGLSLESVGKWSVVLAEDGEAALSLASNERPDVILLDVMMPGLDGPATLERLRADDVTARIPVIFVTAKVHRRDLERYHALGVAGVIAKPFDPMTLADEVRALVEVD